MCIRDRPQSTRSLTFWGRFLSAACRGTTWDFNVAHPMSTPLGTVDAAYYPECAGVYGASCLLYTSKSMVMPEKAAPRAVM